jgi:hypothetical protein
MYRMTSTRNKNTRGNYYADENGKESQRLYSRFENQGNGKAYTSHFAGDGLLTGQMGSRELSHNYADIDSYLKGIGSTNLVTPLPIIDPKYKKHESLSIIYKMPLYMPAPMQLDKNQRPLLR